MPTFVIRHCRTSAPIWEGEAADLREAVASAIRAGASLRDADLRRAVLCCAVLRGAVLREADLRGAVLRGAALCGAFLWGAALRDADLCDADLRRADLCKADLRGAFLHNASLHDAVLCGAVLDPLAAARLSIVPAGELVVWKICRQGVLARLKVPAAARRSNAAGRKCRAEFAEVLELVGLPAGADHAVSLRDETFIYRVGATVRPDRWCEDRWEECGGGIHFFLTREEAEAWDG